MIVRIDRASLRCAEEIFRTVGISINCLQTYSERHPRYTETLRCLHALIDDYFQKNPDSQSMVFLVEGKRVEFRKIPLVSVGAHGERLVRLLDSRGLGGIQFQRDISPEELGSMVRELACRPSEAGATPPGEEQPEDLANTSATPDRRTRRDGLTVLPVAEGPASMLISRDAAQEMQSDWPAAEAGEGDDLATGLWIPEFRVFEDTARSLLTTYRTFLSRPEEALVLNHDLLRDTVDQTMSLMASNQFHVPTGTPQGYFDDFTFHHSVNVCLVTTSVAGTIVRDREKLRTISLAALLHDVGKMKIPEEILHKPAKLTRGEFELMKRHPLLGAEMLLGIDRLDPLCVSVAFGHHLLNERAKYPETRRPFQCDWITRLISVVDIYEALTAVRPYKKGLSPETAFEVMFAMPGLERSLDIVKFVYDCIGPYPIGAVVELSTGERAVVTGPNPASPRRPRVKVFTDPARLLLDTPFDLDLADPPADSRGREPPSITRTVIRQSLSENPWREDVTPEPTEILGAPLNDDQTLMTREG